MKTYSVTIPVYSEVTTTVKANNEEEAKELALLKAVEETPLVSWMHDLDRDTEFQEVQ